MKKLRLFLILSAALLALLSAANAASGRPEVILYTYYRQVGWGDRVQAACVDSQGGLWLATGFDSQLRWPCKPEEQLAWLQTDTRLTRVGALDDKALFDLKGLVLSVDEQEGSPWPAACDAGAEASYAVQYDAEGGAQCVLLGMSGDSCFENLDPDAQALYLTLRQLFPQVTCYGGGMGPAGFAPVSLSAFCGWGDIDLRDAEVRAWETSCEEGPLPVELTEAEQAEVIALVRDLQVTGKANASGVTGGTGCFSFYDREGRLLASVEFYKGLLVRPDGMYTVIRKGE